MNVVLIVPPSPFLMNPKVMPPLGVLYLAANLKAHDHEVAVIDMETIGDPIPTGADFYGISATSPQISSVPDIVRRIRSADPYCYIALGGPHATVAKDKELLPEDLGLELIVRGEADTMISWLVQKDVVGYAGVGYVEDIDILPFPDRTAIDIHSYDYRIDGKKATTMVTSRGCPYSCAFCCKPQHVVRFRATSNVLKEAKAIKEIGFDGVMIYDDEFFLSAKRDIGLAWGLSQLDLVWRCFSRSNLVLQHSRVVEIAAECGLREILLGIESGSNTILKNINKKLTREQNVKAVKFLKRLGIRVKAALIVGLPGETHETIKETESFVEEAEPEDCDFTMLSVYPGSDLWVHPEKYDIGFSEKYLGPYKTAPGSYSSSTYTSAMTSHELLAERDRLEKKFKKW
jgi:anaerobic magnesium-protoporphyrin IX monomethyl ester cyclase